MTLWQKHEISFKNFFSPRFISTQINKKITFKVSPSGWAARKLSQEASREKLNKG
jgi:hypothetical protein